MSIPNSVNTLHPQQIRYYTMVNSSGYYLSVINSGRPDVWIHSFLHIFKTNEINILFVRAPLSKAGELYYKITLKNLLIINNLQDTS